EADLDSAEREIDANPRLAYRAMYDAARIAFTAALEKQGLRVMGGEGGHRTVYRAIAAQVGPNVTDRLIRPFDRMRNMRNQVEYDALRVTQADVAEDLPKAAAMVRAMREFASRVGRWEPPGG
ncbi:MAG: hypothetical protein LBK95_00625, partial [Bifidobacteriaceae bacterium]|nr:hypothetical protein [Bifidobacteriaceae bacterium]